MLDPMLDPILARNSAGSQKTISKAGQNVGDKTFAEFAECDGDWARGHRVLKKLSGSPTPTIYRARKSLGHLGS